MKSKRDKSYYIGQTNNLEDRIKRHNTGRSKYTKNKMPLELVYSEKFDNRIGALQREKEIKSWKSTVLIIKLVERPD